MTYTVVLEDGSLWLHRRPDARLRLLATAADAFSSPLGRIRFYRDAGGRVTEFGVSEGRVYDLRFARVR